MKSASVTGRGPIGGPAVVSGEKLVGTNIRRRNIQEEQQQENVHQTRFLLTLSSMNECFLFKRIFLQQLLRWNISVNKIKLRLMKTWNRNVFLNLHWLWFFSFLFHILCIILSRTLMKWSEELWNLSDKLLAQNFPNCFVSKLPSSEEKVLIFLCEEIKRI